MKKGYLILIVGLIGVAFVLSPMSDGISNFFGATGLNADMRVQALDENGEPYNQFFAWVDPDGNSLYSLLVTITYSVTTDGNFEQNSIYLDGSLEVTYVNLDTDVETIYTTQTIHGGPDSSPFTYTVDVISMLSAYMNIGDRFKIYMKGDLTGTGVDADSGETISSDTWREMRTLEVHWEGGNIVIDVTIT